MSSTKIEEGDRFWSDRNGIMQRMEVTQVRRSRVLISNIDTGERRKLSKAELLKKFHRG